uniref:Uncharacterized protein n=1 Tax=Romanomermis culicivorax TaxID=13658 RepID=A0A915L834_ROMCU
MQKYAVPTMEKKICGIVGKYLQTVSTGCSHVNDSLMSDVQVTDSRVSSPHVSYSEISEFPNRVTEYYR